MSDERPDGLLAISAHARSVPAADRAALASRVRELQMPGTLLIETCHRVELHGNRHVLPARLLADLPPGTVTTDGLDAARQLIRLAVGRDSAIIGEDQVLHQLRVAAQRARAVSDLEPQLDRLIDMALRAGRQARSWLPGHRSNLAERAIANQAVGDSATRGPVLVVGAGEMGRLAAVALRHRHEELLIASRSVEHAQALAARVSARAVAVDPGAEQVTGLTGVVLALNGAWPISRETAQALVESEAWLVDLSTPAAIESDLAAALGRRLTTIDDLAQVQPGQLGYSPAVIARLDALVEQTVAQYADWVERASQRHAAEALTQRAQTVGSAELGRLLDLVDLDDEQRQAVERMVGQLTRRLLRDPLEQLSQDPDGRHARAARELFRL